MEDDTVQMGCPMMAHTSKSGHSCDDDSECKFEGYPESVGETLMPFSSRNSAKRPKQHHCASEIVMKMENHDRDIVPT